MILLLFAAGIKRSADDAAAQGQRSKVVEASEADRESKRAKVQHGGSSVSLKPVRPTGVKPVLDKEGWGEGVGGDGTGGGKAGGMQQQEGAKRQLGTSSSFKEQRQVPAGSVQGDKGKSAAAVLQQSQQQLVLVQEQRPVVPPGMVECYVEAKEGWRTGSEYIDLRLVAGWLDLWKRLQQLFPAGCLPDRMKAKLVYMDGAGDWLVVAPDQRWSTFSRTAARVVVCSIYS